MANQGRPANRKREAVTRMHPPEPWDFFPEVSIVICCAKNGLSWELAGLNLYLAQLEPPGNGNPFIPAHRIRSSRSTQVYRLLLDLLLLMHHLVQMFK